MSAASTAPHQHRVVGKPFPKGVSGNPAGRPVGSRQKLTEDFLRDLSAAWTAEGPAALIKCAQESPDVFVRVVSTLMPKQAEFDITLDILHRTADIVNAFRVASDVLGVDAKAGVRRLERLRIDHE